MGGYVKILYSRSFGLVVEVFRSDAGYVCSSKKKCNVLEWTIDVISRGRKISFFSEGKDPRYEPDYVIMRDGKEISYFKEKDCLEVLLGDAKEVFRDSYVLLYVPIMKEREVL